MYLKPQGAFDQRFMLLKEQIVCIRPVDATDLVYVAKALGYEQRSSGAGAFEHRIDCDG